MAAPNLLPEVFLRNFGLIAALAIPVGLFAVNLIARLALKQPQSAGADAALAVLGYDFTVIAEKDKYVPLLSNHYVVTHFSDIVVTLLVLGFVAWAWSAMVVEQALQHRRIGRYRNLSKRTVVGIYLLGWFFVVFILYVHIAAIALKG